MHVASLFFVGGGGCENPTEKVAVGVVGLTSGGAPQRATNYSICKNLLLECALGCPLHVQEGDRDVQSPTSRQLGSREVVVPGFVAEGVKANKGDNSTCTQKAGHVASSYNTSMSSPHREGQSIFQMPGIILTT